MEFYILIILLIFTTNSTDKTLSAKLCEINAKLRPSFDEIFGEKWDSEKMDEYEADQNDNCHQNDQNELNNSIGSDQNDQLEQKREIIHKFHAIREGIKKRGKYTKKIWNKIEQKIVRKLGISRSKIYKCKKELKIKKIKKNEKNYYEKKKQEFAERIDEFKRIYKNGKQKQFAKELGIDETTLRKWKKEFGIEIGRIRFTEEEKRNKMNVYYKKKKENASLSHKEIAEFLKIKPSTLYDWKKKQNNC